MIARWISSCLGVGTSGKERAKGKGEGGQIWWKYWILMYEDGAMRPAETKKGEGKIKKNDGGGKSNWNIL
jgi:hypothetical protein